MSSKGLSGNPALAAFGNSRRTSVSSHRALPASSDAVPCRGCATFPGWSLPRPPALLRLPVLYVQPCKNPGGIWGSEGRSRLGAGCVPSAHRDVRNAAAFVPGVQLGGWLFGGAALQKKRSCFFFSFFFFF